MLTEQTIEKTINLSDLASPSRALHVGVLSDTHGEISDSVLKVLAKSGIILHAGDVCGQSVLTELSQITGTVVAVGGNNDGRFSYKTDRLPDLVHVRLPGGQISILHGHQFGMAMPDHDAMRAAFPNSRAIIYGHSHHQVHDTDSEPWLLNPGAAGQTRTNGGASCAVISILNNCWDVMLHKS